MRRTVLLLLLSSLAIIANGANILGIFGSHSPSHNIIHMAEVDSLVQRGHNVTVITVLPLKVKDPKFHHVLIPPSKGLVVKIEKELQEMSKAKGLDSYKITTNLMMSMINIQYDLMFSKKFQNVINGDTKFDLLLLGYAMNDFNLAVAQQLKIPVVLSWVNFPMTTINNLVGNPNGLSYVPNAMVGNTQPMTFSDRLKSFVFNVFMFGAEKFMHYKFEQYYEDYKNIMKLHHLPSYSALRQNVSLVLGNSHFSDGLIRAQVPNYIEVGGIQIKPKPDTLDKELQDFLDQSSETGAIFFTMGSNVKMSKLDPSVIKKLYNVLSTVKQNVVWKWDDPENVPGRSKNIFYRNWLPQNEILAHENVKLFITHGGKGSIVESQYHGVPMVGLPVFGDQPANIKLMVDDGYGLMLSYQEMTEDGFKRSIEEVLYNRIYSDNVQRFSKVYRDRPMSPRDTAAFWIEYVIRHHGAPHMQSPLVYYNTFVQYSLDVVGFILLVIFVSWKVVKFLFRFIFARLIFKKTVLKVKKNL